MKNAVIEKAGKQVSVTLHPTGIKAVKWAVALALENTSGTKAEIRDNIVRTDGHEDGDYGVYVCEVTEIAD